MATETKAPKQPLDSESLFYVWYKGRDSRPTRELILSTSLEQAAEVGRAWCAGMNADENVGRGVMYLRVSRAAVATPAILRKSEAEREPVGAEK